MNTATQPGTYYRPIVSSVVNIYSNMTVKTNYVTKYATG